MNICRSPALEAALIDSVDVCEYPGLRVEVSSAGVSAVEGAPSCEISLAHVGHAEWKSRAQPLTGELLANADLILVAQTSHLTSISEISNARPLAFTALAAARCATPAAAALSHQQDDQSPSDRLRSWVAVMAAFDREHVPPETRLPYGPNDIPDPHVLGISLHASSGEMVRRSATAITEGARRALLD